MSIVSLLNALPGAVAQGLIWGIMAIGVYITFRILDIADLTVDGTLCTGGAVCIMMMQSGHNVWVSLLVALIAGLLAWLWNADTGKREAEGSGFYCDGSGKSARRTEGCAGGKKEYAVQGNL